jgi:hypothetical protein
VNVVSDSMYQVTLADLTATSYSFVNNQLTLYNGSSVVDRLKYTDSNSFGVYQSGSNVIVSDFSHGTAIPLHAGV